jgi:hypothetical protein
VHLDGTAAVDPLVGLAHLAPIAVVGADRLRALAAQPVDWVWRDYAVNGTIVVMAGPPSGGKTTLLFLVLLARAASGQITLLDRSIAPAPPGRYVVLIEGEHGEASAARKLVKSAGLLKLSDAALDRIIVVARKAVTLGSDAWKDVEKLIERGRVSDLAIDTLARVAPGDANSEAEQAQIFDSVARAIELAPIGAQPVAWLVAHTRKDSAADLDDVSGSTQRVGQADSVIMVRPERDKVTKQVTASTIVLLKAREDPETYPDAATLTIAGSALSVGLPGGAGRAEQGCSDQQLASVQAVIAKVPPGTSLVASDVIAAAGVGKKAGLAAMRELERVGMLTARESESGKRGWDRA